MNKAQTNEAAKVVQEKRQICMHVMIYLIKFVVSFPQHDTWHMFMYYLNRMIHIITLLHLGIISPSNTTIIAYVLR